MRWIYLIALFWIAGCSRSETQENFGTKELLEKIVQAESKEEIYALRKTPEELNALTESVLKTDDLQMVSLLQRALKNYNALSQEKTAPFTQYYKHYLTSAFSIPKIDLTLDVKKNEVMVLEKITVLKERVQDFLALDGVGHRVSRVFLDGKELKKKEYRVTPNELILLKIPDKPSFVLEVESRIDPFHNEALEGLYASGDLLTTQCESEGARRIFYTLDRPDVLSKITTTIIADKKRYPYRLSNGNLVKEEKAEDGRSSITWEDPIPKPSYLFACVLGDFDRLEDHFTTKSGRKVSLEAYVEKGKKERGTYSLFALKKAMEFDERFFDREYDLDSLKMVSVPDFNSGAMENKGLLIFNDQALLVDANSGTDASFRRVATVVAHEYFHNWSGNRVTIRNWFELALKEGFTDFRATLFAEWLYGFSFIRPKDVAVLKEKQFPEELSEEGHPIMVDSYVNARSIYDSTTYVKGREVFRALQTYLDMMMKEGFRKAQNLYYERYDGQAVTFKELLSSANEVLQKNTGKNLDQFERWFRQQGTPRVSAEVVETNGKKMLKVSQSCIHPKTKQEQEPLLIPFSYELFYRDGRVFKPKQTAILSDRTHFFEIGTKEEVVPVFMHGYSAPVILDYPYTARELAMLLQFAKDPYSQWEAGQSYALFAIQEWDQNSNRDLMRPYREALKSSELSPLAKAQLLQLPSLRALSQRYEIYDFRKIAAMREKFSKELAAFCKKEIKELLAQYQEPVRYEVKAEQMQIRELRKACLNLLSYIDPLESVQKTYFRSDNFDTSLAMFSILCNRNSSLKHSVSKDFYDKYHKDKMVFNHWLAVQSSASICTVADLKKLLKAKGYDGKNPNHIRSVFTVFASNLARYHDPDGEGYAFLVDQIIEVAKFNPMIAHNHLASVAFVDYEHLPKKQKELMTKELRRLQQASIPPETLELIQNLLKES